MDSSVSPKDKIWFLRVCHHISNAVYLLIWRLDGPQNRPGRYGKEENLFLLPGIEPQFLSCPARTIVQFSDALDFTLTRVLQYKDNTKGVNNVTN